MTDSPDMLDTRRGRGEGVRRLNRVPMAIAAAMLLLILGAVTYTYQLRLTEMRRHAAENDLKPEPASASSLLKDAPDGGFIPAKDKPQPAAPPQIQAQHPAEKHAGGSEPDTVSVTYSLCSYVTATVICLCIDFTKLRLDQPPFGSMHARRGLGAVLAGGGAATTVAQRRHASGFARADLDRPERCTKAFSGDYADNSRSFAGCRTVDGALYRRGRASAAAGGWRWRRGQGSQPRRRKARISG